MRLKQLLILTLLFLSKPLFSQDSTFIEKIVVPAFIDTLFIDRDASNWSVRLFTNYKVNRFRVEKSDEYALFTPNKPLRFGVGIGTRKFLLDIAFNFYSEDEDDEVTSRTDLVASFLLTNHQINCFFQRYEGYDSNNGMDKVFRSDITTFSSGITYLYMFNADEYSVAARKTGLARQKMTAYSWGLGGFLFLNQIKADSSIVTENMASLFNEEARIENLFGVGGGVLANFSVTVPFLTDFFVAASVIPGIGLMWKKVESESVSYTPKNPMLYQADMVGSVGYTSDRIYINLSVGIGLDATSLGFDNSIIYSRSNSKLAVGYKLKKK